MCNVHIATIIIMFIQCKACCCRTLDFLVFNLLTEEMKKKNNNTNNCICPWIYSCTHKHVCVFPCGVISHCVLIQIHNRPTNLTFSLVSFLAFIHFQIDFDSCFFFGIFILFWPFRGAFMAFVCFTAFSRSTADKRLFCVFFFSLRSNTITRTRSGNAYRNTVEAKTTSFFFHRQSISKRSFSLCLTCFTSHSYFHRIGILLLLSYIFICLLRFFFLLSSSLMRFIPSSFSVLFFFLLSLSPSCLFFLFSDDEHHQVKRDEGKKIGFVEKEKMMIKKNKSVFTQNLFILKWHDEANK